MKKILILTESIAGTGHYKAAENIAIGIMATDPQAQIVIDTALSHVNPFLERVVSCLYMNTIQHASQLWGLAYQRNRMWSFLGKRLLRSYTSKKLYPLLMEHAPDTVISTHAFCLGGLADLKQKVAQPYRLAVAFTDYCVNPFWIHPEVDYYFVGAQEMKSTLEKKEGIAPERVFVTGIPIDPCYSHRLNSLDTKAALKLDDIDLPLCLVMGGGLGILPFKEILQQLALTKTELNICIVTGRNIKQKNDLETWLSSITYPHIVQVKGYVTNLEQWMSAADLLIAKPGGLTVSEAFSCRLPILIYKPIPGQEERNSDFLIKKRLALKINQPSELKAMVDLLCENEKKRTEIKQRMASFSKPDAVFQLSEIIYKGVE